MLGKPINTTLLELDATQKQNIRKAAANIKNVIEMMWAYLQNDTLTKDTADLTIKTIENSLDDMAKPFEYQSTRKKEKEETNARLRSANQKIRELQTLIGKNNLNNPEAVKAAMQYYANTFHIWYEACGFHYANIERISEYGYMEFDFSPEVETERNPIDKYYRSDPELAKIADKIYKHIKPLFDTNSTYDLIHDGFRCEILGTENNQKQLTNLFKTWFPNHVINNFNYRRNDYGSFSIRLNITLSLNDIAYMIQTIEQLDANTKPNATEP